MSEEPADRIDEIQAQWRRVAPELDTAPIAVLGRIRRIDDLAGRQIERLFASHGLERGEFDVLASLFRAGPPHRLTPTDLYQQLLISSGGLTHRLKCLEKAGLIVREPSSDDGRSKLVRLSAAGAAKVIEVYREDLALEARLVADLSKEETKLLAALLRKLHLSLDDDPSTP